MEKALRLIATTIVAICFVSGCATTSLFNPYPNQAKSYQSVIGAPAQQQEMILTDLDKKREKSDGMLYMMERARLLQLSNRFEESIEDFKLVITRFNERDAQAKISLTDLGNKGASTLTNDNAIPYREYGFERILVHHFQTLNYLALEKYEAAAVELRKAALEQKIIEEQHHKAIAEAEEKAQEKEIDISGFDEHFSGMNDYAADVKSAFQIGYTFYVSANLWESMGEFNDALVDYKKALELNPENHFIQEDIGRVSYRLGLSRKKPKNPVNAARVVVWYEDGFIPSREEISIPIPIISQGQVQSIIPIAFPVYHPAHFGAPSELTIINEEGNMISKTEQVSDMGALAVKSLKEQIPGMLVRQFIRAGAKHTLRQEAAGKMGALGNLGATLYNVVSEKADRRNWLTLPQYAHISSFHLAPKQQSITLKGSDGMAHSILIDSANKATTFVRVVKANGQTVIQQFQI
ncbi:MAG: hypothetical protein CMF25_05595 [Kangiellaceae bacterium]|nr:hypothetical protein [Kangiellaceae bacterium]|tara:strand:- start:500 stop:1894 length:1395 start_codon:yes stop_codon:yes gene_type:complete